MVEETDTITSSTTVESEVGYDCDDYNPCKPENAAEGKFYFPHKDPTKYVQCSEHEQCYVMNCSRGLVWDSAINACHLSTITTSTISSPSTTSATTGVDGTTTMAGETEPITSSTTVEPEVDYDCDDYNPCTPENAAEGKFYFPHKDPTKYVQCSEHGQCYVMNCSRGLVWDEIANTCNYPTSSTTILSALPTTSTISALPRTSTTSSIPTTSTTSSIPPTPTTSSLPTTSTTSDLSTTSTTSDLPTTSTTTDLPTTSTTLSLPTTSTTSALPTTSTTSDRPTTSTTSDLPTTSTTSDLPTTSTTLALPRTSTTSALPTTSTMTETKQTTDTESSPRSSTETTVSTNDDVSGSGEESTIKTSTGTTYSTTDDGSGSEGESTISASAGTKPPTTDDGSEEESTYRTSAGTTSSATDDGGSSGEESTISTSTGSTSLATDDGSGEDSTSRTITGTTSSTTDDNDGSGEESTITTRTETTSSNTDDGNGEDSTSRTSTGTPSSTSYDDTGSGEDSTPGTSIGTTSLTTDDSGGSGEESTIITRTKTTSSNTDDGNGEESTSRTSTGTPSSTSDDDIGSGEDSTPGTSMGTTSSTTDDNGGSGEESTIRTSTETTSSITDDDSGEESTSSTNAGTPPSTTDDATGSGEESTSRSSTGTPSSTSDDTGSGEDSTSRTSIGATSSTTDDSGGSGEESTINISTGTTSSATDDGSGEESTARTSTSTPSTTTNDRTDSMGDSTSRTSIGTTSSTTEDNGGSGEESTITTRTETTSSNTDDGSGEDSTSRSSTGTPSSTSYDDTGSGEESTISTSTEKTFTTTDDGSGEDSTSRTNAGTPSSTTDDAGGSGEDSTSRTSIGATSSTTDDSGGSGGESTITTRTGTTSSNTDDGSGEESTFKTSTESSSRTSTGTTSSTTDDGSGEESTSSTNTGTRSTTTDDVSGSEEGGDTEPITSLTTVEPEIGYDCDDYNPCTPENAAEGKFYFPHKDPTKYIQCSEHEQCYVMNCSYGLVWDPAINACHLSTISTSTTSSPSTTSATTGVDGTTAIGDTGTITLSTKVESEVGYDCDDNNPCTPENAAEGKFYFPHKDPTKYVQCSEHGQCYVMNCSSGLVWDAVANTCNYPAVPSSTTPAIPKSTTPAIPTTATSAIPTSSTPVIPTSYTPAISKSTTPAIPTTTTSALRTTSNTTGTEATARTGDTEPITTSTTVEPDDGYDCDDYNPCTPENAAEGKFYFPHKDPTKYVQCSEHGQCYVMNCSKGLVWDAAANTCNYPAVPSSTTPRIPKSTTPAIPTSSTPAILTSSTPAIPTSTTSGLRTTSATTGPGVTTRTVPPTRLKILSCLQCADEPMSFCNTFNFSTPCHDVSEVCVWTIQFDRSHGNFRTTRGCMSSQECKSRTMDNDQFCDYGTVTDSCTWCCEDSNNCNYGRPEYSVTSPATLPSTTTQLGQSTQTTTTLRSSSFPSTTSTNPATTSKSSSTTTTSSTSNHSASSPATSTTNPTSSSKSSTLSPSTTTTNPISSSKSSTASLSATTTNPTTSSKSSTSSLSATTTNPNTSNRSTSNSPQSTTTIYSPTTTKTSVTSSATTTAKVTASSSVSSVSSTTTSIPSPTTTIRSYSTSLALPSGSTSGQSTGLLTHTTTGAHATTLVCPTVATTVSTPSSECDLASFYTCMSQFQQLVMSAYKNPDVMFAPFCGSISSVFRCLSTSMASCQGSSFVDFKQLNETLEVTLRNMTSQCPTSCDIAAGFQCSVDYFNGVVDAIIGDLNCHQIDSVQFEQSRCRMKTVGNCDVSIRDQVNASFAAMDEEIPRICDTVFKPSFNQSDDSGLPSCQETEALACIKDLGLSVIKYFNGGQPVADTCQILKTNRDCYTNKSSTCSKKVQFHLGVAWNFTENLIRDVCTKASAAVCNPTAARSCILELWTQVDVVKDFQAACDLVPKTMDCVAVNMAGCQLTDQNVMNTSLGNVMSIIGKRCDDIVNIFGNTTLELTEGGDFGQIEYSFTKSPLTICGSTKNCSIYVDIGIEVGNSVKCRSGTPIAQAVLVANDNTTNNLCSRSVTESNWNTRQQVTVAAKLDFKYDGTQVRSMFFWFRLVVNGTTIEKRCLQNFTLIIHDGDSPAICSSINDPHITTFDGWYFNNFREGFFVLYRHVSLPYEVQIATQMCNIRASCNCAAGIRSGDTVVYIDRCRKKSFVNRFCPGNKFNCVNLMKTSLFGHDKITPGTHIYSRVNGKEILVILPHGTSVKVAVNDEYLNVWVTASPIDWKRSTGLCGNYDNNPSNDLVLHDGSIYAGKGNDRGGQPDGFVQDWSVLPADNLYTGVPKNSYSPPWYCECRSVGGCDSSEVKSSCGSNLLLETCDLDTSGTEMKPSFKKSKKSSSRRRRQAADESDFDIDPDLIPVLPANVISRADAEKKCNDFFTQSQTAQICQSNSITSSDTLNNNLAGCIDDLVVTGNDTYMMAALEGMKESCFSELGKNSKISEDTVTEIQSVSCPYQCSGQGECVNGSCICNDTYIGDDCGINLNVKLEYVALYANVCDIRTDDCSQVPVIGLGFIQDVTECLVQPIQINNNHISTTGYYATSDVDYISPNEVRCNVSIDSSYFIQLRNNNQTTTEFLFIVYDSVCYDLLVDPSISLTKQTSSCVIASRCYGPGEENPEDSCKICRPENSQFGWSDSDSVNCPSSHIGLIIGLSVGLGGTLLITSVIIVSIAVYKKRHAGNFQNETSHPGSFRTIGGRSKSAHEFQYPPPDYDDSTVKRYDSTEEAIFTIDH